MSFKAFNLAMIEKETYKLIDISESLITKFFKAKYFLQNDYFGASIKHNWGLHKINSNKTGDMCVEGYMEC